MIDFERKLMSLRKKAKGSDVAFLMMPFNLDKDLEDSSTIIKERLSDYGVACNRADWTVVSDDLWENIRIYMHVADYGIAIYEKMEQSDYNPNVSIELGYMIALGTPVCLLKEKGLPKLPSDMSGKLYFEYDKSRRSASIKDAITRWGSTMDLSTKPAVSQPEQKVRFVILPPGVGTKSLKRLLGPFSDSVVLEQTQLRSLSKLSAHSFSRHLGYLKVNELIDEASGTKGLISLTEKGKDYLKALFRKP